MSPNNKLKAKDILKTDGIISLDPESKLAEAVDKFKSSHDAVMVMEDRELLGLVTPYYTLIKRSYPSHTKLQNCLFSPPKIHLDTPLSEVARLMLESKIHYLPVISEKRELLGIVTARRILRTLLEDRQSGHEIGRLLSGKGYLQTVNIGSSFEEVTRFFESSKLSKLIITDRENHLEGIVSMFDLLPLFIAPKERKGRYDRGEEYAFSKTYKIQTVMKRATIRVDRKATLKEVIRLILDKEIGSVIVMEDRLQPLNIITTSDILKHFYL